MPRKVIYPPDDLIEAVQEVAANDPKLNSESETWSYLARQGLQLEEAE
jgi:hypothetical protein